MHGQLLGEEDWRCRWASMDLGSLLTSALSASLAVCQSPWTGWIWTTLISYWCTMWNTQMISRM
jgi:hypothetical protein